MSHIYYVYAYANHTDSMHEKGKRAAKHTYHAENELEALRKMKQEFCARNGIQFGTGKKLPTVKEFDEAVGPVGLLAVSDGKTALDKLEHFDPSLAERLDNVIRELQEIRASL